MFEFKYNHSGVSAEKIKEHASNLEEYISEIKAEVDEKGYIHPESSAELALDREYQAEISNLVEKKKDFNFTKVVVVGIGGSNLGTWAISDALNFSSKLSYLDTVDPLVLEAVLNEVKEVYKNKGRVMVVYISKSGSTTEAAANFGALLSEFKKYEKNIKESVVVITTKGSKLWEYASKKGYNKLTLPEIVGGRYSVLSSVGMFPLEIAGFDFRSLLDGAGEMTKKTLKDDPENSLAVLSAAILYESYLNNIKLHNSFIFNQKLKKFGAWYLQLVAESLGKDNKGMFPILSIGTTDLHSVAQFFYDGSVDMFTTFISAKESSIDFHIPVDEDLNELVEDIEGRNLSEVYGVILDGVKQSYKSQSMPYAEIILEKIDARSLGGLMQMKMLETMFLGKLMGINTFNQPAVELYKNETRKLLDKD